MAEATCPECGANLGELTAEEVRGHSLDHWPEDIDVQAAHREAIKRQAMLTELFEDKRAAERNPQPQQGDWKGGA